MLDSSSSSSTCRWVPFTTLLDESYTTFHNAASKDYAGTPGNYRDHWASEVTTPSPPRKPVKFSLLNLQDGFLSHYKDSDNPKTVTASTSPNSNVTDSNQLLHNIGTTNKHPILPNNTTHTSSKLTFYAFCTQLTFGLPSNKNGFNVADLFREGLVSSCSLLENFSPLPYEEGEKDNNLLQPIKFPDDNPSFYTTYFFNHHVHQHGNLTGMVIFQTSTPWAHIKSPSETYFNCLHQRKVYLNQTKFKMATLVACGFLVGAHPG